MRWLGSLSIEMLTVALSNAFGFGGHNTCAAFKKFDE